MLFYISHLNLWHRVFLWIFLEICKEYILNQTLEPSNDSGLWCWIFLVNIFFSKCWTDKHFIVWEMKFQFCISIKVKRGASLLITRLHLVVLKFVSFKCETPITFTTLFGIDQINLDSVLVQNSRHTRCQVYARSYRALLLW